MKGETPSPAATPENPACTASPRSESLWGLRAGQGPTSVLRNANTEKSPSAPLRVTVTRAMCAPGLA